MYKKITLFILLICFLVINHKKEVLSKNNTDTSDSGNNEKIQIKYHDYYLYYNGYIDKVMLFNGQYDNKDYDEDGKIDRIYRRIFDEYDNNQKYLGKRTNFRIDFGNGEQLIIGNFDDVFIDMGMRTFSWTSKRPSPDFSCSLTGSFHQVIV